MAIKKCYRLWVVTGFIHTLPISQCNTMDGIDEDYHTKKEWLKAANEYVKCFNEKFNTSYTYQQFFGEPDGVKGWAYCTKCGESFWFDDSHECED